MHAASVGVTASPSAHHKAAIVDPIPLAGWSAALRLGREDRGDSRSSLARSAGTAQSYVSNLENGQPEWVPPVALRLLRVVGWEPVLIQRWAIPPRVRIPDTTGDSADGGDMPGPDRRLTLLDHYDPTRIEELALDDAFKVHADLGAAFVDIGAGRLDEAAHRLEEVAGAAARAARRCRIVTGSGA